MSELAVASRSVLAEQNSKELYGKEDMLPAVRDPGNILMLTAGGPGLYSMVMPSWCAGPHRNVAVHEAFDINPFCEVPGAR